MKLVKSTLISTVYIYQYNGHFWENFENNLQFQSAKKQTKQTENTIIIKQSSWPGVNYF